MAINCTKFYKVNSEILTKHTHTHSHTERQTQGRLAKCCSHVADVNVFIRNGRKVHEAKRMNIRYIQAETSALGQDTHKHTHAHTQAHLVGHEGGGRERDGGRVCGQHSHVASGKLSTQH